jgi:hypothetical protein
MEAIDLLETIEEETGPDPQWTVLWLHGLGADGNDFVPLVPELVRHGWPSIRFVFPHAPVRAVTINAGMRMRAWYDIRDGPRQPRRRRWRRWCRSAQVGSAARSRTRARHPAGTHVPRRLLAGRRDRAGRGTQAHAPAGGTHRAVGVPADVGALRANHRQARSAAGVHGARRCRSGDPLQAGQCERVAVVGLGLRRHLAHAMRCRTRCARRKSATSATGSTRRLAG